jgi:hypothetical protein
MRTRPQLPAVLAVSGRARLARLLAVVEVPVIGGLCPAGLQLAGEVQAARGEEKFDLGVGQIRVHDADPRC